MFDGVIDSLITKVTLALHGFTAGLADYVYLGEWFVIGLAVLGGALALSTFFPFAWVRAPLGVIVIAVWSFIFGLVTMWRRERSER